MASPPRPFARALLLLLAAASAAIALGFGAPVARRLDSLFERLPGPRPLASYLRGALAGRAPRWSAPDSGVRLAAIAREQGVDPALLKGLALALSCPDDGQELLPELSPAAVELLRGWGEPEESFATAEGRLEALARTLPPLVARLGSPDAALLALVVGLEPVAAAAAALEAKGLEPTYERLLPKLPRRLRRGAESVVPAALALSNAFALDWPVGKRPRVSSGFGPRIHPVQRRPKLHLGVDLPVPVRTPVAATGEGRVLRVGEDQVNGRYVVLDHGRGLTSAYLHNEELLVTRGEPVARGQQIALSGNTGRSTGPHLHYQVELEGEPVDPLLLFQRGEGLPVAARRTPSGPKRPLAAAPQPGRGPGVRRRAALTAPAG